MGVFNKNGAWWIDFRDQHGRRHREKVGTSKKFAEKAYAKKIAAVAENRFLDVKPESKSSFKELAEEYRKHIQHRPYFHKDNHRLKQLEKRFGKKLLVEVTVHEVERYRQEVTPCGKIAWNRLRSMLHRIFELGSKWGMCEHNPVSSVERYKESSGKTRFLSPKDELPRFLAAAQNPDLLADTYALLVTAIFTGLRRSEEFRLRWSEVDFETGTIHVNRLAKSRRSREIPMTALVKSVLTEQKKRTGHLQFVFCTQSGKPYRDRRETLATVLTRAGISNFTWHDMRHCFASYLAMSGVDLLRIKELLGHSDIKMTLRYAHLSPSFVQDSVRRLESFGATALPAPTAESESREAQQDDSLVPEQVTKERTEPPVATEAAPNSTPGQVMYPPALNRWL